MRKQRRGCTSTLPRLAALGGGGTLFLSIAAGTPIRAFEAALGEGTPIVRAMPNTPAAIGQGISALVGNAAAAEADMALAEALMGAVGRRGSCDGTSRGAGRPVVGSLWAFHVAALSI